MGVKWINYKGKQILYIDYRGAKGADDSIPILKEAIEIERRSAGSLLILQNYEGTRANEEFLKEIKELGKEVKDKVLKNAIVGFDPIKKVLLTGYLLFSGEKNIRTFDAEDQAKEWLIQE